MPKKRIRKVGDVNFQKCNKFDFVVDKEYEFGELPKKLQKDISTMFLEDFYDTPEDFIYRCYLMTPGDAWEIMGEDAFTNIEQFELDRAERRIKREGLDYPVVQPNYKMLIYSNMDEDIPYLDMIRKAEVEE